MSVRFIALFRKYYLQFPVPIVFPDTVGRKFFYCFEFYNKTTALQTILFCNSLSFSGKCTIVPTKTVKNAGELPGGGIYCINLCIGKQSLPIKYTRPVFMPGKKVQGLFIPILAV